MTVKAVRFGPGTLKLGTTPGTDYSCQVQSMGLEPEKDEGDSTFVLCGDSVPGAIKYTFKLTGTVLQDMITAGLQAYTWTNKGTQQDFEFVPQTGATGQKVSGKVVIDPIAIGSSDGEFGDVMTADVEWSVVGTPTVTWASVIPTGFSEPVPGGYEAKPAEATSAKEPATAGK